MIDIVIPEYFKDFVSGNMRILVFGFILSQIAIAYAYVFSSTRGNALLRDSQLAGDLNFKGLRFNFKSVWDYLAFGLFVLLLALFGWLLFDNAELCIPDQAHITGVMHGGLWMQIVPQTGRFSPMLHQEFLIFGKIFESTWSFYLITYLELLLLCIALLIALPVKSLSLRLLLIASLVFSYGFQYANSALICPEVHIVFGFLAFMYLASRTKQSRIGSLGYFCGAGGQIFLAAYLIYLKEPIFLVFGSYSLIIIATETFNNLNDTNQLFLHRVFAAIRRSPVENSIFCLSFVYSFFYLVYIFIQTQARYGSSSENNSLSTIIYSLQSSYFVGIYILLLLLKILRFKDYKSNAVFNSLAFSFIFYYLALIILGMTHPYYYVPIAFMGILLAAEFLDKFSGKRLASVIGAVTCLSIVAIEFPKSISHFHRRELYMISRKLTSDSIKSIENISIGKSPSKIYFLEKHGGYDSGIFVAYLNYKSKPSKFYFENTVKNPIGQEKIPVGSISLKELNSSGFSPNPNEVFVGLSDLGGQNIDFEIPEKNTKIWNKKEIIPETHIGNRKKLFYSKFSHQTNSKKMFNGTIVSF
jgi:hypothetical protein